MTSPAAGSPVTAVQGFVQGISRDFAEGAIRQIGQMVTGIQQVQRGVAQAQAETNRFGSAIRAVLAAVQSLVQFAGRAVQALATIPQTLRTALTMAQNVYRTVTTLWAQTLAVISRVLATIRQINNVTWPQIQRTIAQVLAVVVRLMNETWPQIQRFVAATLASVNQIIGQTLTRIQATLGGVQGFIRRTLDDIWANVNRVMTNVMNFLDTRTALLFLRVEALIRFARQQVSGFVRDIPTLLVLGLMDLGTLLIGAIGRGLQQAWQWTVDRVRSFAQTVSDVLVRGLLDLGQRLIEGIGRGLERAWNWLSERVRDFAENISSIVQSVLGIFSPSRVMIEIGGYVGEGLAIGIERSAGVVGSAAAALAEVPLAGWPPADRGSPAVRTPVAAPTTVNVYPRPGQSEYEIGRVAAREIAWAAKH